ncbi:MAG: cytochrome-c peroxidase [Bdellovibrionales bacterium]|nr:cytochrome-c peroxidase [Bdellovibrionales bacterium]
MFHRYQILSTRTSFCFLAACWTLLPLPSAFATPSKYNGVFSPLPELEVPKSESEKALLSLGEKLYLDPVLSENMTQSCNSCHQLGKYGVDGEATSPGAFGKRGDRNSPSSYNAFLHIAQFWDGRAKDVEEQALGPVLNPVEMAMPSEDIVVKRLKGIDEYQVLFKKAFADEQDPIRYVNVGKAIGAFERTLITPSRFDDFLRGNASALTAEEQKGLQTFVEVGCTACHMGTGVGGSLYQKIGLVKPYKTDDLGRYEITKQESDKFVFKVPSLRNIAETGPYYHDGSVKTLEEAVQLMGTHQLGRDLTKEQIHDIVLFLNSLTGKLPERFADLTQR